MKKKLFLIISLIPLIIFIYLATQWIMNDPGTSTFNNARFVFGGIAVILSIQMIFGIMAKLTGFNIGGKKSIPTIYSVFTEESYIVSVVFVSMGVVLYLIISVLLSFVLEQEIPILTFALTFLVLTGGYLEIYLRGKSKP